MFNIFFLIYIAGAMLYLILSGGMSWFMFIVYGCLLYWAIYRIFRDSNNDDEDDDGGIPT